MPAAAVAVVVTSAKVAFAIQNQQNLLNEAV